MSLACGLFTGEKATLVEPKESVAMQAKERLEFTTGDPTAYGNPSLRMPQSGYEIVKKAILNTKNHSYTGSNGTPAAREAIAKHYGNGGHVKINGADVILTQGANMGLFIALMSITNPGDNILVPEPGYPFFQNTAPSVGVEARTYRLLPNNSFEIDLEHLATLVDSRTRFLWVVNPSNPTGAVFSESHMNAIFDFCRAKGLFIISDEVYWNESFSGVKFTSFGHATTDVPVIVIGGVEKTFLVPGWGISWMIFVDANQQLKDIKQACLTSCQVYLHPCSFLMAALPELLDTLTVDFTKKYMDVFEENHDYLLEELESIQGIRAIPAQGTFFLSVEIDLTKFSQFNSDVAFLQTLFEEENLKMMQLSAFGCGLNGFRLMTCATKEIYNKLIPRLRAFCGRHYNKESSA